MPILAVPTEGAAPDAEVDDADDEAVKPSAPRAK